MKTNEQTHEIIEDVRLVHKQMSDFYEQLHRKDEKGRVKLLLDYLTQHEKRRDETLTEYEDETSSTVLDTWFKFIPVNNISSYMENMSSKSNISVSDVVSIALELDDQLINIYKYFIDHSKSIEVKSMFTSLLKRLEQEKRNLARDSLWLNDY